MEIASTGPQSLRSEYNTDTEVTEYVTEVTEYVTTSSTASNSTIDMAAGEEAARRLWLTAENGADDQEDGADDQENGADDQEDGDDLNNNNNNKNDGDGMEGLDDGGGQKEKEKGESADPSPTPSPTPSSHDYALDIAESALQQLVM